MPLLLRQKTAGKDRADGEGTMSRLFRTAAAVLTAFILGVSFLPPAEAITESQKEIFDEAAASVGAAIVYNQTDDVVLYTKNGDKQIRVASITKVLNACTASQFFEADDEITVGDELSMVYWNASVAPVKYGERYTFEQLLHAMLLPSGCDAAYVLAAAAGRKAAGDDSLSASDAVSIFVGEMNKFLESLGCTDSYFVNPDGQDEGDQHTTCLDYIKVLRYAVEHPLISTVICKAGYECLDLDGGYHYFSTTNGMVAQDSSFYYPGAKGIKTGTTDLAGCCLAVAAERDGKTMISLLVNADSIYARYAVTTELLNAAFSCRMMGDVDYDSRVTPADARLALRLSVGLESEEDYEPEFADMDGDTTVSADDARTILRLAVGLE